MEGFDASEKAGIVALPVFLFVGELSPEPCFYNNMLFCFWLVIDLYFVDIMLSGISLIVMQRHLLNLIVVIWRQLQAKEKNLMR